MQITVRHLHDVRRFGWVAGTVLGVDTLGGETVAVAFEWVFKEYLFLLAAAATEDELEGGAVREEVSFESSAR